MTRRFTNRLRLTADLGFVMINECGVRAIRRCFRPLQASAPVRLFALDAYLLIAQLAQSEGAHGIRSSRSSCTCLSASAHLAAGGCVSFVHDLATANTYLATRTSRNQIREAAFSRPHRTGQICRPTQRACGRCCMSSPSYPWLEPILDGAAGRQQRTHLRSWQIAAMMDRK